MDESTKQGPYCPVCNCRKGNIHAGIGFLIVESI